MAYRVAWELGVDIEEVRGWTPYKFEMWVAFLQIQDEAVKKGLKSGNKPRRH